MGLAAGLGDSFISELKTLQNNLKIQFRMEDCAGSVNCAGGFCSELEDAAAAAVGSLALCPGEQQKCVFLQIKMF